MKNMTDHRKKIKEAVNNASTEIDLLHCVTLPDEELQYLVENCPTLTKVSISRTDFFTLLCLTKLPNLENLTLNGSSIQKPAMEELFKLKNLCHLSLQQLDKIPDNFFKELVNHIPNLRSFASLDSEFLDIDLIDLSRLEHLTSLTLQRTDIRSEDWKYLRNFKSLLHLEMAYEMVNFEGLEDFLSQLQTLRLTCCHVDKLYLHLSSRK